MKNPERFLIDQYPDLPGSKPVERAVEKKISKGEKGPSNKEERVEIYLDRMEEILESGTEQNENRGFELLKSKILDRYVTKYETIPEKYWKAQEQEMRKRGEGGDWSRATQEQKEETRKKHAEVVLTDQRASLEQWIDYFVSADSDYIPRSLKYWIFRNILQLQELVKKKEGDKEYIEFPKRSKGTVKPFPDINHEALSYVVDAVVKHLEGQNIEFEYDIQPDERETFNKALAKEDFAKLYAWASELMNPVPEHLLPQTQGEWVTYPQNSDPKGLVESIRGKGTGWCTAGLNTAKVHLQGGDFHVYYSLDDQGKPTVPRLAIRMDGHDKIAEDPRGIAYKQNLDSYMVTVLEKKLQEFGPIGGEYKKKSNDMRLLTEIENRSNQGEPLTRDDLVFLYELNSPIEGFGYQKDPRIEEIRSQRNLETDLPVIFECQPSQIARSPGEIARDTKVYVGVLEPGVFDLIWSCGIEHIYTSFPERIIKTQEIEIGGKDVQTLERMLAEKGMHISDYAKDMLKKMREEKESTPQKNPEKIVLARLKVRDLGFKESATTDQIYNKARELGLEPCPAEVGPRLRLEYGDQPLNEWIFIAIKQITDRVGNPCVFNLARYGGGLWLDDLWADPGRGWPPGRGFVLRLRKFKT